MVIKCDGDVSWFYFFDENDSFKWLAVSFHFWVVIGSDIAAYKMASWWICQIWLKNDSLLTVYNEIDKIKWSRIRCDSLIYIILKQGSIGIHLFMSFLLCSPPYVTEMITATCSITLLLCGTFFLLTGLESLTAGFY